MSKPLSVIYVPYAKFKDESYLKTLRDQVTIGCSNMDIIFLPDNVSLETISTCK